MVVGLVAGVVITKGQGASNSNAEAAALARTVIPLKDLGISQDSATLLGTGSVSINGSLVARNTLTISPSAQPSTQSPGQIYYDATTNQLAYYNGTKFVSLTDAVADAGALQAGTLVDGALTKYVGGSLVAASLLNESGDTVAVDGNLRISGDLALSGPLSIANGGTGTTALEANGVVTSAENGSLGAITAAGPNLCLVSTATTPVFSACPGASSGSGVVSLNGLTGAVSLANASASGGTVTINDASTAGKGLASFNATNFTVSGGAVNTVQDITVAARPSFSGLVVTGQASGSQPALAVATQAGNTSGITINTANGIGGNAIEVKALYFADKSVTLSTLNTTSADQSILFPNASGTICLQFSAASCGYAVRGGNSDITSLSGLTTALSVVQGGTGVKTFTANGVLYGNTTGNVLATSAGTTGQCLVATTGAAPSWGTCAPTNIVNSLNGLTGSLTLANATASGATVTVNDASTTQKGLAQFNSNNFTVSGGVVNTVQDITTTADPTFRNLALARLSAVSGQATNPMLLLNNTNLAGTGNLLDVQQNGTSRFSVAPNGDTTIGGSLVVNTISPTGALTIGASGQNLTLQGAGTTLKATSGGTTNSLTFATPSGANKTITMPNASGTVAVSASGPLALDASGNLTCVACITTGGGSGGGGSAVESLNSQTGALTLSNATASSGTITINDASTSQKGIAQFDGTNFTASGGTINTIQNIGTSAAPVFGQLALTSSQASAAMLTVNNTDASATGNLIDLKLNGSSRLAVTPAGDLTVTGTVNGQTVSSAANFTGSLTVASLATLSGGATVSGTLSANTITPTGALTVGATNQSFTLQGSASSTVTATSGGDTTSLAFQTPTASVTYRLLTAAAGTYDLCTTVGTCAGVGGGVTTPGGTTGKIAKFTAAGVLGDSILTESSATVTVAGTLAATTAVQAPLVDTASAIALNVGTTNATAINLNQNTTLAAGKSLTITGGNTASRPASPAEGMLYYDTTTKGLLTYANGKWQADRSSANKIVAMGTATGCSGSAPVASQNPDGADFVTTSCTSAQTVINSAITALPSGGGTVYIMDGTYILDGTITLPSNVKLTGAGAATILKLKDSAGSLTMLTGTTITRSVISNMRVDGNKANNASGNQFIINISTTTATTGTATISDMWFENLRINSTTLTLSGPVLVRDNIFNLNDGAGISLTGSSATISGNTFSNANSSGTPLSMNSANNISITGNTFRSNTTAVGFSVTAYSAFTGNTLESISNIAISFTNGGNNYNTISGNTFSNGGSNAISMLTGTGNVISGNGFYNNGGSGTASTLLVGVGAISTLVTNNIITDTAGTGYAMDISVASAIGTYLSNNTYSGTGGSSINDAGTSTVYANQTNSSGALTVKPLAGLGVGTTTATNSLTVQGSVKTAPLPTPTAPTLTTSGTAGSTSYSYVVTALDGSGETTGSTTATIATGNATLTSTNRINISIPAVGGAIQYKVYRTASGGTPSTTGLIGTFGAGATITDTGLAGGGGNAPGTNTTGGSSFGGAVGISTLTNAANAFTVQDASANSILSVSTNNYAGGANAANATLKVAMDSVTSRSINAAGTINASGADFAEYFTQAVPGSLRAGDLACLTGTRTVTACTGTSSSLVGAVSTKPGYVGNDIFDAAHPDNTAVIAMLGQVPVRVSDANGIVHAGDMLAPSSQPGVAVRSNGSGYVVGIAMETHSGSGMVNTLIRPQWYSATQNNGSAGYGLGAHASFASLNVAGLTTLADLHVTGLATIARLEVETLTVSDSLRINGHIITGGDTPVVTAAVKGLVLTVTGNDTAGTIGFTAPVSLPAAVLNEKLAK